MPLRYEPLNNRAGRSAENSGVVVIRAAIIQFSERKNNSRPSRAQEGHMPPPLHDEERRAALFTHVMQRADMRMLELRDATSFPVEALSELRIRREVFREDLDRHDAIEPRIPRFIHLPHAADAERRHDFV